MELGLKKLGIWCRKLKATNLGISSMVLKYSKLERESLNGVEKVGFLCLNIS